MFDYTIDRESIIAVITDSCPFFTSSPDALQAIANYVYEAFLAEEPTVMQWQMLDWFSPLLDAYIAKVSERELEEPRQSMYDSYIRQAAARGFCHAEAHIIAEFMTRMSTVPVEERTLREQKLYTIYTRQLQH